MHIQCFGSKIQVSLWNHNEIFVTGFAFSVNAINSCVLNVCSHDKYVRLALLGINTYIQAENFQQIKTRYEFVTLLILGQIRQIVSHYKKLTLLLLQKSQVQYQSTDLLVWPRYFSGRLFKLIYNGKLVFRD